MNKWEKETLINWIGGIFLVLAIAAGVSGIIWAANTYGNQMGKECIKQGRNWRLVENTGGNTAKWECRD